MTDAQIALQGDPTSFVNGIINNSDKNSVDAYLDGLDGPSEDDLVDLTAENDLDNEEME